MHALSPPQMTVPNPGPQSAPDAHIRSRPAPPV